MLIIKIMGVNKLSPTEEGFLTVGIENILVENERNYEHIEFIYTDGD